MSLGRERQRAIAAARRHTFFVRVLKRGIVVVALLGMALLGAVAFIDPFSNVPGNISLAGASLNGTRITMELPKLDGYRKDGKPYQVRARTGVQDVRQPKIIELNEIEARIQVEESNSVSVIAPAGVFDSGNDSMKMQAAQSGDFITLKSTSGYTALLKSADVNLKAGSLVSNDPVSVQLPSGTILSESVVVGDGGKNIVFNGNVRSVFRTQAEGEADAGANQNDN